MEASPYREAFARGRRPLGLDQQQSWRRRKSGLALPQICTCSQAPTGPPANPPGHKGLVADFARPDVAGHAGFGAERQNRAARLLLPDQGFHADLERMVLDGENTGAFLG